MRCARVLHSISTLTPPDSDHGSSTEVNSILRTRCVLHTRQGVRKVLVEGFHVPIRPPQTRHGFVTAGCREAVSVKSETETAMQPDEVSREMTGCSASKNNRTMFPGSLIPAASFLAPRCKEFMRLW